jgi:hypothetical protein
MGGVPWQAMQRALITAATSAGIAPGPHAGAPVVEPAAPVTTPVPAAPVPTAPVPAAPDPTTPVPAAPATTPVPAAPDPTAPVPAAPDPTTLVPAAPVWPSAGSPGRPASMAPVHASKGSETTRIDSGVFMSRASGAPLRARRR